MDFRAAFVTRHMLAHTSMFRASATAFQTIFSVMGTSAHQFLTVPGDRYVFGFIQRQYSRSVSSSLVWPSECLSEEKTQSRGTTFYGSRRHEHGRCSERSCTADAHPSSASCDTLKCAE